MGLAIYRYKELPRENSNEETIIKILTPPYTKFEVECKESEASKSRIKIGKIFAQVVNRGRNDGGIDIKVAVRKINFVIQCKNWKKCISPSVVREMEGVLTRQPESTIGVIVGPSICHYSEATKELATTSKFSIKLLSEDNIIFRLKIYAAVTLRRPKVKLIAIRHVTT
ncbi:3807_t:CDS:2 [Funneliformis geosporum]|nr:3807_t:CDS:2 [Funneliformis geosporum]